MSEVLARGAIMTRGTGKPGHYVLRQLPDGRVCGTIRVTGANIVNTRVGKHSAVMGWMSRHVEIEEEE